MFHLELGRFVKTRINKIGYKAVLTQIETKTTSILCSAEGVEKDLNWSFRKIFLQEAKYISVYFKIQLVMFHLLEAASELLFAFSPGQLHFSLP